MNSYILEGGVVEIFKNNTKFTPDGKHTKRWGNELEQNIYFDNLNKYTITNYRYKTADSTLLVELTYTDIKDVNYLRFKNFNSEKWWYCFIVDIQIRSKTSCILTIKNDVLQSRYFELMNDNGISTLSIWGRLSPLSDIYGENLAPEGLEMGREYEITGERFIEYRDFVYCVFSSVDLSSSFGTLEEPKLKTSKGLILDNIPCPLDVYVLDDKDDLTKFLEGIADFPWIGQCISSINVIPSEVMGLTDSDYVLVKLGGNGLQIKRIKSGFESKQLKIDTIEDFKGQFDGVKYNKMLTFPFAYLEMTMYDGQSLTLYPESLPTSFDIKNENFLGVNSRVSFYPDGYLSPYSAIKGDFLDTAIIQSDFPTVPLLIDNYLLYMGNNANQFKFQEELADYNKNEALIMGGVSAGTGILGNLLSGNIGGAVNSAISGGTQMYQGVKNERVDTYQRMAKINDMKITPPSQGGQFGGNFFNISNELYGIHLKWKQIKPFFRKCVQDYFDRFGYNLNQTINDNILFYVQSFDSNKPCYVEGADVIINAQISNNEKIYIKNLLESGVTFNE